MTEKKLGAARIFASNYQIVVCDDPERPFTDDENWTKEKSDQGFAGNKYFRMIGTYADLNDHWIELVASGAPPNLNDWQGVTCVQFHSATGQVHIMSVVDDAPTLSATIDQGDYAVYLAGQNLGVDQRTLGEEEELTDAELALRKDLEWYRIFIVPGDPKIEGHLKDT